MITISNEDFAKVMRLLFSIMKGRPSSTREAERQRQARLLIRKFSRKRATADSTPL